MRLEIEKIRSEKYYRIGYISVIDKHVIATLGQQKNSKPEYNE